MGGILKGYLVSSAADGSDGGWRHMYSAAAPVALVMGLGVVSVNRMLSVNHMLSV